MGDIPAPLAEALRDRYVLERELGRGGMGLVWLACDLRHKRLVALKVIRPDIVSVVGVERFLREIQLAAQLQHPNIVAVYESGDCDGTLYYVMPYVEGESLRARLRREPQLPLDDALEIARHVADALAYAHAHGVVHRDIKPENILLAGTHALVLDFGIARAITTAEADHLTETGLILGTPTYMSPEQASGDRALDGRTDIYSLGCVVYEMLAGHPPFMGPTPQAILARHARDPAPALRTVRPSVPDSVERAIAQAVAKVPADRFRDAGAFANALGGRPSPETRVAGRRRRLLRTGTVFVLLIAAVMLGILWQSQNLVRDITVPRHRQLTFTGNAQLPEVSPDGQFLAFVEGHDTSHVIVKDLASGSLVPVGTFGAWVSTLRWSPDGRSLLCAGGDWSGKIKAVLFPRFGGIPRALPSGRAYNVLSPDGSRLASWYQNLEAGIVVTMLGTGTTRTIDLADSLAWLDQGDWSPDGRWITVLSASSSGNRWMLWNVDAQSGSKYEILSDSVPLSPPRWLGDGLYYIRDRNELRRVAMTQKGLPAGSPSVLAAGLGASHFSIAGDGKTLVYSKEQRQSNLWRATMSGPKGPFTTHQLTRGTAEKTGGHLSPDGRLIAFLGQEGDKAGVYVLPVGGGEPHRIAESGALPVIGWGRGPAWSPDGQRVAFITSLQGRAKVQTVALEGGEVRIYGRTAASQSGDLTWAPHQRILYQLEGYRGYHWLEPETEAEEPLVTYDSLGWMLGLVPSLDRMHVAVFWNRKEGRGTYVISLRDAARFPMGPQRTSPLGWSIDNKAVYVQHESDPRIRRIALRDGGNGIVVGDNPFEDAVWCDLKERSSGLMLLCMIANPISDAWIVEKFDRAAQR